MAQNDEYSGRSVLSSRRAVRAARDALVEVRTLAVAGRLLSVNVGICGNAAVHVFGRGEASVHYVDVLEAMRWAFKGWRLHSGDVRYPMPGGKDAFYTQNFEGTLWTGSNYWDRLSLIAHAIHRLEGWRGGEIDFKPGK